MAGLVSAASALSLLLPRPRRLERLEGTWSLPPTLRLACPDQVNANAKAALERLEQALRARGHGLERTTEPDPAAHVRMRIEPLGFGATLPPGLSTQAYAAIITNGSATISAISALGLGYALSTLTQLIELSSSSPGALELPCVSIEDSPDFPV